MRKSSGKKKVPKRVLRLPELDFAKGAVLNTLGSPESKRAFAFAIEDVVTWYCSEPRLAFSKTVVLRYRLELEARRLAPATITSVQEGTASRHFSGNPTYQCLAPSVAMPRDSRGWEGRARIDVCRWRYTESAVERKPIPFLRTEFNENSSKLLRQREDVHGVAAAGRVRLGSQAHTEGSDRAATSRDGDVLASVDRIHHGPADDL